MYLYFDRTGTLREIVNDEALRQGNYGINKIFAYIEDRLYTSVDASYLLPSKEVVGPMNYTKRTTAQIPFDPKRDLRYFRYYKDYSFAEIDLENDLDGDGPLDEAGAVHASLSLNLSGGGILQLGDVNMCVEETQPLNQPQVASEEYMSLSDYLYLRNLVEEALTSCARSVKASDTVATGTAQALALCAEAAAEMDPDDVAETTFYVETSAGRLDCKFMGKGESLLLKATFQDSSRSGFATREESDPELSWRIYYEKRTAYLGSFASLDNGLTEAYSFFQSVVAPDESQRSPLQLSFFVEGLGNYVITGSAPYELYGYGMTTGDFEARSGNLSAWTVRYLDYEKINEIGGISTASAFASTVAYITLNANTRIICVTCQTGTGTTYRKQVVWSTDGTKAGTTLLVAGSGGMRAWDAETDGSISMQYMTRM